MGLPIDKDRFSDEEFEQFEKRLADNLQALAELLQRDGFGVGDHTLGAELELDIVDENARPLELNRRVLSGHLDSRLWEIRCWMEQNRINDAQSRKYWFEWNRTKASFRHFSDEEIEENATKAE